MAINVRLINITGMGPVLAVIQGEAVDRFVVTNPCQLGTDDQGEIVLRDYLEFISKEDTPVEFFKSSIISISEANPALANAYISALEAIEAENAKNAGPKLFVPDNKIITK